MSARLYMDWNATAPLAEKAKAVMLQLLSEAGNPSSVHFAGRAAREHLERARIRLAEFIEARAQNIIFTASGTEANNLALANHAGSPVFVSAIEHDSVIKAAIRQKAQMIHVTPDGAIDLEDLEQKLRDAGRPAFVSVMLANNETGVIQPVAEAAAIVHRHGGLLHCDASQALNRIPVNMVALGADMLTVSSHKASGPMGVGALVLSSDRLLTPILVGGGQERSRRAGTENVPAIAGFAAALGEVSFLETRALRDYLEEEIIRLDSGARIFGKNAERLPNTSAIAASGKKAEALVISYDLAGIAISAGSACSSGKMKSSHVIEAMGWGKETASHTVRISMGPDLEREDIDRFVGLWRQLNGLAPHTGQMNSRSG